MRSRVMVWMAVAALSIGSGAALAQGRGGGGMGGGGMGGGGMGGGGGGMHGGGMSGGGMSGGGMHSGSMGNGGWQNGSSSWHGNNWHGNGWYGGWYGPSVGFYLGYPGYWGWPYAYGYPYGYASYAYADAYPAYAPSQPTYYFEDTARAPQAPAPAYWYYCTDPAGYYPYVRNCASPWVPVVPQNVPGGQNAPAAPQ